MRYLHALPAFAILLLAACEQQPATEAVTQPAEQTAAELNTLVEEYFEKVLELNPLYATAIGDYRYNDRLANTLSPEYLAQSEALDREYLERVLAIDAEALNGQDRLTYDTFRWSREMDVAGYRFPAHLQPINQFYSITNTFVQLGSGANVHPFKTVKDY
ncbi:MAG TPA: DUF885 family protein, partial [Woeseiaceae bacterium]|nr:DUF885 family protein [Woeseiaceae bacterium]